jgi:hypothetical protein
MIPLFSQMNRTINSEKSILDAHSLQEEERLVGGDKVNLGTSFRP